MANKLYEETHIANIANAIRSINGKTESYTVAEMGNAIRSTRRVYKGTITDTTVGSGKHKVLIENDSFLAEHRANPTLFVRVEFEIDKDLYVDEKPPAYTIVKTWAANNEKELIPTGFIQNCMRIDGNSAYSVGNPSNALFEEGVGVGALSITADGELRIYSNSASNYAIRPSTYTVIVEC